MEEEAFDQDHCLMGFYWKISGLMARGEGCTRGSQMSCPVWRVTISLQPTRNTGAESWEGTLPVLLREGWCCLCRDLVLTHVEATIGWNHPLSSPN